MNFINASVLIAATVMTALAQHNSTFQWKKNTVPLATDLKDVRILLTGSEPCHSVVGVRVDGGVAPSVSLAEVAHQSALAPTASFRRIAGVNALPAERFSVSGNQVTVVCGGNRDSIVDLFVSVTHPINITLANGSGTLASLAVEDGVIIRDGVAVSAKPAGMHQLLLEGMSPITVTPRTAAGTSFFGGSVELGELKNHVQSYAQPQLGSAPVMPVAGVIRLEIDEAGRVTNVSGPSVALLDRQAIETIRTWLFQPFVAGGKAIQVAAVVPFHIAAQGAVSTALEPSARVY